VFEANRARDLDAFFVPKSVAVIGATETPGSVGRTLLENLTSSGYDGHVYPVNPKRATVLGIPAFPGIRDVPGPVDLAVIVTPAPSVPGIIADCVSAGVRSAVVISAGFKEVGAEGAALEQRILEEARRGGMRIIGPNCLGVMSPRTGFNATFAQGIALPGNVAFLSQSGALLTAVLDYTLQERIGFSAVASIGSMVDVGWGDLIDYFGNDPNTQSIVIYMESVGDARSFLSAAREVALTKPIVVIKAGRTSVGALAAASHTGALTGSDAVLDAAFARAGILRVDNIAELFALTDALAKQPRPKGNRLTILTNAGGPGVLATDALISGGGRLAPLSDTTRDELSALLPAAWSHANPVDVLGDATPDRYARALEAASRDPASDGLLVILTPQAMTDPEQTAECLAPYATKFGKPVFASWMGGATVADGERILAEAGIPTFAFPDVAVSAFNSLWAYTERLDALYETPTLPEPGSVDTTAVAALLDDVQASGRTLLTEYESKRILSAYGIPTVETWIAVSPDEASAHAEKIGYPVVLKLHSNTITHKTDVGGVQLNLGDSDAVRAAYERIQAGVPTAAFQGVTVQAMVRREGYEIILGLSPDPQFGPVVLFGAGGELVEVLEDSALCLPPLTSTLARRVMEKTRIYRALKGVRGRPPADLGALEQIMVRFSQLAVQHPLIREIDINPLMVSHTGIQALDARIVLYPSDTSQNAIPRPAIRPYPTQYARDAVLSDGTKVMIRPLRPEDEPALVAFHGTLSERSVTQRYGLPISLSDRVRHERLRRIVFADYDRHIPLAAFAGKRLIAVARLSRIRSGAATPQDTDGSARFAIVIGDHYQERGLGTILMQRLLDTARAEGIRRVTAEVRTDNRPMQHICKRQGFTFSAESGTPSRIHVSYDVAS